MAVVGLNSVGLVIGKRLKLCLCLIEDRVVNNLVF